MDRANSLGKRIISQDGALCRDHSLAAKTAPKWGVSLASSRRTPGHQDRVNELAQGAAARTRALPTASLPSRLLIARRSRVRRIRFDSLAPRAALTVPCTVDRYGYSGVSGDTFLHQSRNCPSQLLLKLGLRLAIGAETHCYSVHTSFHYNAERQPRASASGQ